MPWLRHARVAGCLVLLVVAMPTAKKMPPPTRAALVGVWVGLSEDELYAF